MTEVEYWDYPTAVRAVERKYPEAVSVPTLSALFLNHTVYFDPESLTVHLVGPDDPDPEWPVFVESCPARDLAASKSFAEAIAREAAEPPKLPPDDILQAALEAMTAIVVAGEQERLKTGTSETPSHIGVYQAMFGRAMVARTALRPLEGVLVRYVSAILDDTTNPAARRVLLHDLGLTEEEWEWMQKVDDEEFG